MPDDKDHKGIRVSSLMDLDWARSQKLPVFIPADKSWAAPKPAAVLINQAGHVLLRLFRAGMYVYVK
ncbi:MAG: hypothetical protein KOO63_05435 [Bacteroidales bacterium]|nr:hypothetical protein [Candidatus Latescibacterota bacterium]